MLVPSLEIKQKNCLVLTYKTKQFFTDSDKKGDKNMPTINGLNKEQIKELLLSMWKDNNWKEISVEANSECITIVPCSDFEIKSESDCEWYLVYCCVPYLGGNSLDELCDSLSKYADIVRENEDSKDKLRAYFDEHIKGHKKSNLEIGHKAHDKAWDYMRTHNCTFGEAEKAPAVLSAIAKEYNVTEEKVQKCIDLSSSVSFYSDWYKDIYGHRPRFSLD